MTRLSGNGGRADRDGRSSARAGAKFCNPWLEHQPGAQGSAIFKWQWQRMRNGVPGPPPEGVPRAQHQAADPRAEADELRITFIGQASFLIQAGGLNILTDPVFSERASPVSWAGPARLTPPGIALNELPPIDAVVISHDHYDHLDAPTVRALDERFGDWLTWFVPLGFRPWFERRGVTRLVELDWWQSAQLHAADGSQATRFTALPAQHWTRRGPFDNERLWCSWAIETPTSRVYFAGDSGYCAGFAEIGAALGPFDACLIPIGAYEPRWFMKSAHMNPEEAVQTYVDLGSSGAFIGMHWGTFILTDEPVLEPPTRVRAAWQERGLPADDLWLLVPGETGARRMAAENDATG